MSRPSQSQIASVRRFNRFYTREVGALRKNFLDTPWSLGEMRVLFEIANGDGRDGERYRARRWISMRLISAACWRNSRRTGW